MTKLKLAYISPLHKGLNDIKEIIFCLEKHYDMTFVIQQDSIDEEIASKFKIIRVDDFLQKFRDFDRVLYQFENSCFHRYMVNLLEEIPGIIILKDFYLYNLFDNILEELEIEEGIRGFIRLKKYGKEQVIKSVPFNYKIINNSLGVIVHSEELFNLLENFYFLNREEIRFIPNHKIAEDYYLTIENFYRYNRTVELLKFSSKLNIQNDKIERFSYILSRNLKKIISKGKILFDCSVLSKTDAKTGIQRVVKAELKYLLEMVPQNILVEPVRLLNEKGIWTLKYAREWSKKFFEFDYEGMGDTSVFFEENSVYYAPDLNHREIIDAHKTGFYHYLKLMGIKIVFLVYDLLPIEFPQYFPSGLKELHENWCEVVLKVSDEIICNSKATVDSLIKFGREKGLLRKNLKIKWLHLGCDIKSVKHIDGLKGEDLNIFNQIKQKPYFLMVSTIEPRKGHSQVLKAFEFLWQKGLDYNLVFVGKEGWMVDELVKYMENHPEREKRFFWLGYVSDDLLEFLYKNASATIIASEGEGFGLSIIESAYYKTPIIARDIPVFREVAGEGAYYFRNTKDAELLTEDVIKWISLYNENKHPKPDAIKWMTWREHTERLIEILL